MAATCKELDAARASGETTYTTGKPCKRGHLAARFVSDRSCVECKATTVPAWRLANPEKAAGYVKKWRENNPEKAKLVGREHHARNPEKRRANTRKWYAANREYAMAQALKWRKNNPERARELMHKNAGHPIPSRMMPKHCECCGKEANRTLHLDHCHETGKFRGWLCFNCNNGIGKLGDNIAGIKLAVAYLRRAVR